MLKQKHLISALIVLIVGFIFAFAYMSSYRAQGQKQYFYQSQFEQAVMLACGHGFGRFIRHDDRPTSLLNFLNQETDQFSCSDIPPKPALSYASDANAWRWLLSAAASIWWISGVSWPALDILVALLFSASVCFIYGIFRLGMSNVLAIPATVLLALSPWHLSLLPFLRDYGKAPFMLGAIFILGLLVSHPVRNKLLFIYAAALGGLLGIGYGFRPDVMIVVPFAAITLLFLLPGRTNVILRNVLGVGIFFLTFFLFASPIIFAISEIGGCHYHFALVGLSLSKTQSLQIIPSSLYDFVLGTDAAVRTYVESHGGRNLDISVGFCTKNYDLASRHLYLEIFKTFPADFVLRAFSSIRQVLESPFVIGVNPAATPTWYLTFAPQLASFQSFFRHSSYLAIPVLLFLFVKNPKVGIFCLLFILLFGGYPAVQFDQRHYAYLEFVGWWIVLVFASHTAGSFVRWASRGGMLPKRTASATFVKAAVFAVGIATALSLPLVVLRTYQIDQVGKLIEAYQSARRGAGLSELVGTGDVTRWALPSLRENSRISTDGGGYRINEAMLHLRVGGNACATRSISLAVKFTALNPALDFGRTFDVRVPEDGGYTDIYTPIYELHNASGVRYFSPDTVEVNNADYSCVNAIDLIIDRNFHPLWLTLTVPEDWKQQRLYQVCRHRLCRT